MKRLSRVEIISIAVTALFLAVLIGFLLGQKSVGSPILVERTDAETVTEEPVSRVLDQYDEETDTGVPSAEPAEESASPGIESLYPIDINAASEEELKLLPGIGEVLAGRIVEYRKQHGAFSAPEEIMEVSGIGEAKFEAIRDLISTGQED